MSYQPEAVAPRWRGRLLDLLLVALLAGLGAKAAHGAAGARDVDFADEGGYSMAAARLPQDGLPPLEMSPLYAVFQRAMLVCGAPLDELVACKWAAFAALLPISIFVLARALRAGRVAALAVAGFVPATTLIDIWPYPLHLSACVLALGAALAVRLPRPLGCAALGLTLLTATYTRPEYWYSLCAFAPLALGAAVVAVRRGHGRATARAAGAFALGATVLVLALGNPKPAGGRSVVALGQHYANNKLLAGEPIEAPWHLWETYFRADFGDANGVGEALTNNPRAFFWHVGQNAARVPAVLLSAARPRLDFTHLSHPHLWIDVPLAPHAGAEATGARLVAGVVALGFVGVVFGLRNWRRGDPAAGALPLGVLALVLVVAPAAAAALLVFPRMHYAVPTLAFSAAVSAAGFRHLPVPRPALGARGTLVALVLLATALGFVVPNRAKGVCAQAKLWRSGGKQVVQPLPTYNRDSLRALRGLGAPPTAVCLDHTPVRPFFAGFAAPAFDPFTAPAGVGLLELVRRSDVGVVLLDPHTENCPALKGDAEMRELAAGRDTATFRVFPVEGQPLLRYAVRRDLLPR